MGSDEKRDSAPLVFYTEEMADAFAGAVMEVHDYVRERGRCFGAAPSDFEMQLERGKVLSIVENAFVGLVGCGPRERFGDVFDQVSYFAARLALDHIFPDGNKRTALLASMLVLDICSIHLDVTDCPDPEDNDMYQWTEDVVTRNRTEAELSEWLRAKAVYDRP